jgi:hypothetical protein
MVLSRDDCGGVFAVVFEELGLEFRETEAVVVFRGPFYGGAGFEGGDCAVRVGLDLGFCIEGFVCDRVPAGVDAFVYPAFVNECFLFGRQDKWTGRVPRGFERHLCVFVRLFG